MSSLFFSITKDSITVIIEGRRFSVLREDPNYAKVAKTCLAGDQISLEHLLLKGISIEEWIGSSLFTYDRDQKNMLYQGDPIPEDLGTLMVSMAEEGYSPIPLLRFWERLQRNPSYRSVNQLWDFLKHEGIPITEWGHILAYKSVRPDFKDWHTGLFDNTPGKKQDMPRNKISDDPEKSCQEGFHVGSLEYARKFMGSRNQIVICQIAPENVVCVPRDYDCQKMRVCSYEVIGVHGDRLPDFLVPSEDLKTLVKNYYDPNVPEETDLGNTTDSPKKRSPKKRSPKKRSPKKRSPKKRSPKKKSPKKKSPKKGSTNQRAISSKDLMKNSMADLRRYATHTLEIKSASKISGGKKALVEKILAVLGE